MNSEATAQKILTEIQYATIATANGVGDPWNTPVFCAADGYTLYWSSHPNSVHSKNIAATGKAFIVIYNSKPGKGEGVGLYIKASVHVIENKEEITHALHLLSSRRGKPFQHAEKFMNDGPQRIYMAKPLQLWINDAHKDPEGHFIEDFRTEIAIS